MDAARCSVQALERGDSPVATAPPAQRWLLIEQPGPWGRDALTESRFDAAVAPRLAHRARQENVRLLLVRRPGGRLADSGRRWAYADSRPGREGLVVVGAWHRRRPARRTVGRLASGERGVGSGLPGLHARRARRLLRAARPAAGPITAGRPARRRLGVQPPRRRPVRGQRPGAAARLLLRAGARRRRADLVAAHGPGRGGAALAARARRGAAGRPGRPAPRPRRARPAGHRRPAGAGGAATHPARRGGGAVDGDPGRPRRARRRDRGEPAVGTGGAPDLPRDAPGAPRTWHLLSFDGARPGTG